MGNLDNLDSACSLEMTKLFNAGRITPLQFILSCLHHLGPPKTRAYHSDDDEGLESGVCRHLWYRFPYGPVAAAIRLCDNDREANKVDGEHPTRKGFDSD